MTQRSFFDFSAWCAQKQRSRHCSNDFKCCTFRTRCIMHHAESSWRTKHYLLLSQSIQGQPGCFPTQSFRVNQWSMQPRHGKMVETTSMDWCKTKQTGCWWCLNLCLMVFDGVWWFLPHDFRNKSIVNYLYDNGTTGHNDSIIFHGTCVDPRACGGPPCHFGNWA